MKNDLDRFLKVSTLCLTVWGVINMFLWASTLSSWDFRDTIYILSKEGILNGLNKLLPILFGEIVWVAGLLISLSVIFLSVRYSKKHKYKYQSTILVGVIVVFVFYCLDTIFAITFLGQYSNNVIGTLPIFYRLLLISFIYIPLSYLYYTLLFPLKKCNLEEKDKGGCRDYQNRQKVFSIISIVFLILGVNFIFPLSVYNTGYGSECLYIDLKSAENEINTGRDRADLILKNGIVLKHYLFNDDGTKKYDKVALSVYIQNEDKDYINVFILSAREIKNDGIVKGDLMGNKSGVLISIKKDYVIARTLNNKKCFSGD